VKLLAGIPALRCAGISLIRRMGVAGLLAVWSGAALGAALMGNEVRLADALGEDLYAAAGSVEVLASVDGDAVLAAGSVRISGDITGDVMAAAGQVVMEGGVGDDLRAAGGQVVVSGFVTDHAVLAGGSVLLTNTSAVAGRVWASGGTVEVSGQVGGDLKVMGGTVRIAGQVEGDVEVTARELRVEPEAVIGGDLIWRGTGEPDIAEEARIFGDILVEEPEADGMPPELAEGPGPGARVMAILALFLAAAGLSWLAPGLVARAGESLRDAPVSTLLWGAVALVMTPVVVIILLVTVIGWLLALLLIAAWLFGLVLAVLLGLTAVADGLLRRGFGEDGRFPARRLLALLVLAAALVLLRTVPVVGGLVTLVLLLAGLGCLVNLFRRPAPAGGPPAAA
jgi:cytoskeletal protein CcmA (bactofilin family)